MIFDGGLTTVWSKMLRLYWHARHSMSNYRSNLKKNQSFHTQGHHLKVPEWIKNCASTRKMQGGKSLYKSVAYEYLFISRNESPIARWKHLRMISKTQVGHKIHVRVDWWTFFFHPTPPWHRNGGSKICLECKITRFFPKPNGLDWDDRGHLVASTSILGYRIHVGVDWWTQKFCPRPPSAPKVDQKLAQNP